ncbi:MAG: hypothetical protein O3B08_08225 [Proteobacteria bacterium]|nr:hypothetical protein [Pseudomonadota bacterium]
MIPSVMTSYAWLHQFAVSVANACNPAQDFPSFWVQRSGHRGTSAPLDCTGMAINALADDPAQDRFFAMVRDFRVAASDGSLYAPYRRDAGAGRVLAKPIPSA